MPYTPDENNRVQKLLAAYSNPQADGGEGLSVPLFLALFDRIVKLRDFAQDQIEINQELRSRLRRLELLVIKEDSAEARLLLTPASEDLFNE